MIKTKSKSDKALAAANTTMLILLTTAMLIPILYVIATSFSSPTAVQRSEVFLWPVEFTTASWKKVLTYDDIWYSTGLTVLVTIVGTILALLVTAMMAYPMAKKEFPISKILIYATVASMIFKAPQIPYFLTVRNYGLYNNIWVLILPHILAPYNLLIMISFFREFPKELEESGVIDGCGYFRVLSRIVVPCSKAVMSTQGLFYAVTIWNQFSHPLMFIDDKKLYPLQLKIREFISTGDLISFFEGNAALKEYSSETLRAVVILFSFLPIACVYPFVQKNFLKGAMLGSVKG